MKADAKTAETDLADLLPVARAGIPKYLQLHDALAAAIAEGRWKPGAKVPTEDELTDATGLSLGTVQRSLRMLAEDGLIVRRHGAGTFVADEHAPMRAPFVHCGFLNDERDGFLPIYSTVLGRKSVTGEGEWSRYIRGPRVVCIERLFSINDEFLIYTRLYIDGERLPSLASRRPAKLHGVNFKDLIRNEYRLPLTRFSENLRVAVFEPSICAAMRVKKGTAGAVLEIVAYDAGGTPIYFQDLFIPPNRRRLFVS